MFVKERDYCLGHFMILKSQSPIICQAIFLILCIHPILLWCFQSKVHCLKGMGVVIIGEIVKKAVNVVLNAN